MYCFVRFQKGLHSVFDESSQTAWFFTPLPAFIVIFQPIHTNPNLDKSYTRIIRMNHSIYLWKPHENPCSSYWVHREQIDRQKDRRGGGLCFIICLDSLSLMSRYDFSACMKFRENLIIFTNSCSVFVELQPVTEGSGKQTHFLLNRIRIVSLKVEM